MPPTLRELLSEARPTESARIVLWTGPEGGVHRFAVPAQVAERHQMEEAQLAPNLVDDFSVIDVPGADHIQSRDVTV